MPPAKTIFVDKAAMLQTVLTTAAEQAAAAEEETRHMMHGYLALPKLLAKAEWVNREVSFLAGRPLTASERIRHQQALRELAADGLVEVGTRQCRLTDAGRESLK